MNQNMKSLSIAALVMVGMLACVKETPQETTPEEAPGVKVTLSTTVSLAEDTKALTPTGVKTFAEGEQIAVVYNNGSTTVKAVSEPLAPADITNEGHSAQFTVTLTDPDRSQNVTYIYPAAMAKDNGELNWEALASQNGTLATLASQLDYAKYTGAWTAGALPTGTLDNQLAILALTLKSSDGASVITNEIGRLTIFTGAHSYVVTRTPAEGPIYIAIHPTDNADIQLVAQSATRFYTKSLTGKTYAASNGYNASFRMAALPEGALPGKFTVADGKEVYFAKGNLQHVGSSWRFAASQWEYYGTAQSPGNDMFGYNGWSSASSLVSDGWGVLSQAEWNTLINTRTVSNTLHTGARYTLATLGESYKGLIVFPDHYVHPEGTGFTAGTYNGASNFTATVSMEGWAKMEMAGCMFIPAAGYKSYTNGWQAVGSAVCVSSTTQKSSQYYYTPYFADGNVNMSDNSHTGTWSSVRMYKGTAPVTGIALSKTATSIPVGSTETLTATVTPSTAANPGVSWTSNNSAVATVNASTGQITAVTKGPATITATALDGSGATATCTVTVIQEGALTGKFSVASGTQVYFSRGNLQATTTNSGTSWSWSFAEHQWDYVGNATANSTINGNGTVSANGTVDLFGWSTAATTYGIHNSKTHGTYSGSFKDWGENAITNGGNTANSWRTPTNDEWTYFMNTRPGATVGATANARYTDATINTNVSGGVNGRIMFPDGVTFATDEATTWGTINANSDWTTKCTAAQWTALETKGCVFMPAAGYRTGSEGGGAGDRGRYWLATEKGDNSAYSSFFGTASGDSDNDYYRRFGRSVRLVYNAN